MLHIPGWAGWVNGSFEEGAVGLPPPAPWSYLTGMSVYPPRSQADLNLMFSGSGASASAGVTRISSAGFDDPLLAQVINPMWGQQAVALNLGGTNHSASRITQVATMSGADTDPSDGRLHIRMAVLPVMEQADHAPTEQPYVFIEARNLSRGYAQLFRYYIDPSSPLGWNLKTVNDKSVIYTAWQSLDFSFGADELASGDQVLLSIVAAGCSQGGHEGHVYVDGIGSLFPPGLSVVAAGPAQALAGATLSYDIQYKNSGSTATSSARLYADVPPGTTFASLNAPPGGTCLVPAIGSTGTIECTIPLLPPGMQGSMRLTARVDAGLPDGTPIVLSNYGLRSNEAPTLVGPPVQTQVFQPSVGYDVALIKSGSGLGRVDSTPPGIQCDPGCKEARLELSNGNQVTLRGTPADGSYFAGWSGDCHGTGDCVVAMWGSPRTATATFTARPEATVANANLVLPLGQPVSALTPVIGTGGTAPWRYAITPALPAGLSMDPNTGALVGAPSLAVESTLYTVTVEDAFHYSASASFTLAVPANRLTQTLEFPAAPVLAVGRMAKVSAISSSGLTVSLSSQTPATCSVSGGGVSGLAVGDCILRATQAGDSRYAPAQLSSPPIPVTLRDGIVSPIAGTASGPIQLSFDGGGSRATLSRLQPLAAAAPQSGVAEPPPTELQFPYGLLDLAIAQVSPGESVSVTLTYPQPLPCGTQYWKYGKKAASEAPHWYARNDVVIAGDTVTFKMSDGGPGDDDGIPNGSITDPGGPAVSLKVAEVPTLSTGSAAMLAALLLASAVPNRRRSLARTGVRLAQRVTRRRHSA